MLRTQIARTTKLGVISVIRNPVISFSVIFVVTFSLFIVGISLLFGELMRDVTQSLKDKADITVYFKLESTEAQIFDLKEKLETQNQVKEIIYVSREGALAEYRERHKSDPEILSGLEILQEDLPFRARLSVKAHESDEYESIVRFLEDEDLLSENAITIIDKIDWHQNRDIIERLSSIVETSTFFVQFTIILLVFISFLIIFNIERLIIYLSKEEIKVMRLIGADDWYIRVPFLISGGVYGCIGAIVATLLLYPVSLYLSPTIHRFFGLEGGLIQYYYSSFIFIFGMLLFIGVIVGVISGYFSTHRYLDN